MKLQSHFRLRAAGHGEQGYIMLVLLLMIAMMTIALAVAMPTLKFTMQRDREEEMIHRGVQYSNAIRRFYKKFGRYPTKIDDLENSNNIRFLRKRYKDPMNCKAGKCEDFKILYYSDVQQALGSFGGGSIPGASPIGGAAGSGGLGASSSPFGQNSLGQSSAFGGTSSFGNSGSSFGQSSSSFGQSSFGQSSNGQNSNQNTPGQPGTDSSQTGTGNGTDDTSGAAGTNGGSPGSNQLGASGQVIGGPIVGVASATKITDNTIREFNHKKKYKDWMFIYDPMQDQGRLITTPYQPQMQGIGGAPNVNGQNGQQNNNGFGSSPFSNSPSGFQNSPAPNSPSGGAFGGSNQPSSSPQQ